MNLSQMETQSMHFLCNALSINASYRPLLSSDARCRHQHDTPPHHHRFLFFILLFLHVVLSSFSTSSFSSVYSLLCSIRTTFLVSKFSLILILHLPLSFLL